MNSEQTAQKLVSGVQEQFVADSVNYLIDAFTGVLDAPEGEIYYRLARLQDLAPQQLAQIYLTYRDAINKETVALLEEYLNDGTERALIEATKHSPSFEYLAGVERLNLATIKGCREIMDRANVALSAYQSNLWYLVSEQSVAEYINQTRTRDEILKRGVATLRSQGLTTIDYVSGAKISVDAGIRRHLVTQINQNHERLTEMRSKEYNWQLFVCSSHADCRPEHFWHQGKLFSKNLSQVGHTIDGEKVYDYKELGIGHDTGYGGISGVTGIYGANCSHFITPYVPGFTNIYKPEQTVTENQEGYDLIQKQRQKERAIRNTKGEIAALEYAGLDATQERLRLGKEQASIKAFVDEHDLVRRYDLEKTYAAQPQPRARKVTR